MFGSTITVSVRTRRKMTRVLTLVLICLLASPSASTLQAQYPADELPYGEDYSGAMLLNTAGSQLRVSHSEGNAVGRPQSITAVELFHSIPTEWGNVFGDLRMLVNNSADTGGNVGLGVRYYSEGWNRIFGASVWYDGDDTHRRTFHQIGVSLETYGDDWDGRFNFYAPIGDNEKVIAFSPVSPRFSAGSLLLDRIRFDEAAMTGFDMEVGTPIPGELGEAYNVRIYAGWYHFAADSSVNEITGVSGRIEGRVRPDLALRVAITNDDEFDTNVVFGVTWFLPGGRRTNDVAPTMSVHDRLEERVYRNYSVVVADIATLETAVASNLVSGQVFSIIHVNSSASAGGDGSLLAPFQTLAEAQAGSMPGQIIYAHADSVFNTETIVLQAGQQFLGEGIDHFINTGQAGSILLPRATSGTTPPEILDAAGNAITVANGTLVSGFIVTDATGAGISADSITGNVTVDRNSIDSTTGTGISITNSTGTFTLTGTFIDSAGAGSAFVVDGGSPTITNDSAIGNLNGGQVVSISNTTGGSISLTGSVSDSSGQGISIDNVAGSVDIANASLSNTNGTGLDVRNSSGMVTLTDAIFTNNTASSINLLSNTGTVTLTNLDLLNSTNSGIVANSGGTLVIDGSSSIETIGFVAMSLTNTVLDVTLDTLLADFPATNGITLNQVSGVFNVTGDLDVLNSVGAGVSIQNSSADFTFNSLSVDGATDGILLSNNTGSFTVGAGGANPGDGGTIRNVINNGASITNSANVSLNFMNIDASSGNDGVQVTTTGANDAMFQLTNSNIINAVNEGVELNSAGSGTLTATIDGNTITAGNAAFSAETDANNGTINLALSNNVLTSTNRAAADIDGSAGGTINITDFSGNTVFGNGTGNGGVLINTAVFDADPLTVGIQQVAGGNLTIGTSVTRVTGDGLRLDQVSGDLALADLNIFNDGGTGLFVRESGVGVLSLTNTGGNVDTTNGTAIDIDIVNLNSTFASITSTNSAASAIILNSVDGSFTVTGATTIDTSATAAISISNSTSAGALFDFGTVDITNGSTAGIELINIAGTATFGDTTIGTPIAGVNSGITVLNSSGTFQFDNIDITDGGVELLNSTGMFTVDGGMINNSLGRGIDITLGSIDAVFTDTAVSSTSGASVVSVSMVTGGSLSLGGTSTVSATNLAGGIAGVDVDAANADFTLNIASVTVDGNAGMGDGMNIVNVGAGGSATFGSVSVNNAATGILVDNVAGSFTVGAGGAMAGDGGTIQNITGNGVSLFDTASASLSFMNITAGQDGVEVAVSGANDSTISFNSINVAGAGDEAFDLHNDGTGTLAATVNNNSLTSTLDSFTAQLTDAAGTLQLNLNGNDASGTYDLDNMIGGTFQLGGTLGQGMTFVNDDNGNVANNANTTAGGAPTVVPTGSIEIIDPATIPTP